MLHIHPGDSSAEVHRRSGLPGEVAVWADVLHEGPLPRDASPETWRHARARFLHDLTGGALDEENLAAHLAKQDAAVAIWRDHDETVFWFDACLYDQCILVRHLAHLADADRRGRRISLICVGAFPGRPRFLGLGELGAPELASLFEARRPIPEAAYALARRAWDALTDPDPRALHAVAASDTEPLPFLGEALRRRMAQFPSTYNGLSRLETESLRAAAAGHADPAGIFRAVSAMEPRPFFGDTTLWSCLDGLARTDPPLLRVDGPGPLPRWNPPADLTPWRVAVTDAGGELLDGRTDRVRRCGIDRWLGGTRLAGTAVRWRWDETKRRIVAGSA